MIFLPAAAAAVAMCWFLDVSAATCDDGAGVDDGYRSYSLPCYFHFVGEIMWFTD